MHQLVCLAKKTSKNVTRVLDEYKISSGGIPLTDILFLKSQSYFSISYLYMWLSTYLRTERYYSLSHLKLKIVT